MSLPDNNDRSQNTEKESWMMDHNNTANRVEYITWRVVKFLGTCIIFFPFALIPALFLYGSAKMAPLLSLAVAIMFELLDFLVGFRTNSFRDWLEEKWQEEHGNQQEE